MFFCSLNRLWRSSFRSLFSPLWLIETNYPGVRNEPDASSALAPVSTERPRQKRALQSIACCRCLGMAPWSFSSQLLKGAGISALAMLKPEGGPREQVMQRAPPWVPCAPASCCQPALGGPPVNSPWQLGLHRNLQFFLQKPPWCVHKQVLECQTPELA